MKKLFFAATALIACATFANAQTTEKTSSSTVTTIVTEKQEDRVKIKSEDLPEAVKKSLDSEDYRGWLVSSAYHIKGKDQYEIEVKNGAEIKTLKFDKGGNKID